MRFIIDVNLSPLWVPEFTSDGHEAIHWRDVGALNATDDELIGWAVAHDRIVVTADLDFAAIVGTRGLSAPTVVQLRTTSTDPRDVRSRLFRSMDAVGSALVGGAILTLDDARERLRPGPAPPTLNRGGA